MGIEASRTETEWILSLTGIVDIFEAAPFHGAAVDVSQGGPPRVVVRLHGVEGVDVSTTQVLLALARSLSADGRALSLEGTPPGVAAVWRQAGFGELLGSAS